MGDTMTFPKTVEEFMEEYKIVDSDQVYTNGAELVPIFRMKQWFEHINATSDAVPVVRCKDCTNYAGDGMYCAWGLLTGDMGYCHHGYVADRAAATEETGASGERKGGDE